MQKIINEIKLDFDDVLIRPKRSTLSSRSDVDLTRTFKFANSPRELQCVPIMVANMDTVGTINMAKSLEKHRAITCLHKHYEEDTLIICLLVQEMKKYCFIICVGILQEHQKKTYPNLNKRLNI